MDITEGEYFVSDINQFLKVLLNLYLRCRFPLDLVSAFPHSRTFPVTILLAILTEYFSLDSSSLASLLMSS